MENGEMVKYINAYIASNCLLHGEDTVSYADIK